MLVSLFVRSVSTVLGTINDDYPALALMVAKIVAHFFGVPYFEDGTL